MKAGQEKVATTDKAQVARQFSTASKKEAVGARADSRMKASGSIETRPGILHRVP